MHKNDQELYERALIYCHLHRAGSHTELTNPVYQKLEKQLLGWKWRAHPLGLAIARISLRTMPYRLEYFAANHDALFEASKGAPGIRPAGNYPKSKGSELYGGLRFLYDAEALGGLPREKYCEALQAEGVPINRKGYRDMEHLRAIYTQDMPGLWGEGHPGPANMPLLRYQEGDYPIAESLNPKLAGITGWIEAADGLIEQVAESIKKVADHHKELL